MFRFFVSVGVLIYSLVYKVSKGSQKSMVVPLLPCRQRKCIFRGKEKKRKAGLVKFVYFFKNGLKPKSRELDRREQVKSSVLHRNQLRMPKHLHLQRFGGFCWYEWGRLKLVEKKTLASFQLFLKAFASWLCFLFHQFCTASIAKRYTAKMALFGILTDFCGYTLLTPL